MKYLSVCSGIEACTVAWESLGWKALGYSEIEEFPRSLLQHYYPNVPLHGDFTLLKNESWIAETDLLVGGTPCQSFSLAGLRNSLNDDRGNLTLQFVRLADAIDNFRQTTGKESATILWENVPGVLSTDDNAFGSFLGGLCGCDAPIEPPRNGWSYAGVVHGKKRTAAWRILDAQYFGVAQRRRRVFVLATGGARKWRVADTLLPITQSMSWNPRPSRKKREKLTPTVTSSSPFSSTGGAQELDTYQVVDSTGYQGDRIYNTDEAFGTLPSQGGNNGGGCGGLIAGTLKARDAQGIGFDDEDKLIVGTLDTRCGGRLDDEDKFVMNTLDAQCGAQNYNHQSIKNHTVYAIQGGNMTGNGKGYNPDVMYTLDTSSPHATTAFNFDAGTHSPSPTENLSPALRTKGGQGTAISNKNEAIRRLTPKECERLQGFPDDYTYIPYKKGMATDAVRYKALGNSMAVPVMKFIGQQIKKVMIDD